MERRIGRRLRIDRFLPAPLLAAGWRFQLHSEARRSARVELGRSKAKAAVGLEFCVSSLYLAGSPRSWTGMQQATQIILMYLQSP
jgi:hypothetical protein